MIGEEPREKLFFEHKNLKIYGYVKHDKVLNLLKNVSISVVLSASILFCPLTAMLANRF